MRYLAILLNILIALGVIYALAINGVLSIWVDQYGFGVTFGYYQSFTGE